MAFQQAYFLFPYVLSAIISLAVGLHAMRRRPQPGAAPFAYLALMEVIWTTGYILQMLSARLEDKLLWNNIQFVGAVIAPLAFVFFALDYTDSKLLRNKKWRLALWLSAAVLLSLIWTDSFHHLFRVQVRLGSGSPFLPLIFDDGLIFPLFSIYEYLLIIIGSFLLARNYISAPRVFRLQLGIILIGVLIPWITSVASWINLVPLRLHDITPLSFGISNLVVMWALFRYRLFDLVPIAYDALVEHMEDGVVVIDNSLRIVELNPAAETILSFPAGQAPGELFFERVPEFRLFLDDEGNLRLVKEELSLIVSGVERIYETSLTPLRDNRQMVNGFLIQMRDVTDRKNSEKKLQRLAITDPLTDVFNRRHFFSIGHRELDRSRRNRLPMSLILVDVDHFKEVNDSFGHLMGDFVLKSLVRLCLQNLRPYDLMARFGGEEFVILLPQTRKMEAERVAERLRAAIDAEKFVLGGGSTHVTISLGVTSIEDHPYPTFDKLIDRADQALYMAKQQGRNRVRSG